MPAARWPLARPCMFACLYGKAQWRAPPCGRSPTCPPRPCTSRRGFYEAALLDCYFLCRKVRGAPWLRAHAWL